MVDKVLGYNELSVAKVDAVNRNKIIEENLIRTIEGMLKLENEDIEANGGSGIIFDYEALDTARIRFKDAFMWLNRGIFNPGRVELPEDTE